MSDQTQTYFGTLGVILCCKCAMAFGVPDDFKKRRRKDHADFYCPNGHPQHFTAKSKEEELTETAERLRRSIEFWRGETVKAREARMEAERQRSAARGVTTRIKNRVGKGVCPCCGRTFQNLARHMAGKHPKWAQEEGR